MPPVAVVVLCFNHVAKTLACLTSLFEDPARDFAVLVVDNASSDGTVDTVAAAFPQVELLRLPENRGWAGGNNAGAQLLFERGTELICFLNNDTLVPPGTLQRLARTAREWSPCLIHPAIDFADPAEGTQLDPSRGIGGHQAVAGAKDLYRLDEPCGACLMVPTALLRRLNGFDERFFLQLEDNDLGRRAARLGAPALCDTAVRIIHAESVSFGGRITPVKTYYAVRNTLLFTEKHHRTPRAVVAALRSLWHTAGNRNRDSGGSGSRAATLRWLVSSDIQARAIRLGVLDYVCRRFGQGRGPAIAGKG